MLVRASSGSGGGSGKKINFLYLRWYGGSIIDLYDDTGTKLGDQSNFFAGTMESDLVKSNVVGSGTYSITAKKNIRVITYGMGTPQSYGLLSDSTYTSGQTVVSADNISGKSVVMYILEE